MKRLILHIGTYKTGSTSLQQFLADNAGELARQGFCYPETAQRYGEVKRSSNGYILTYYARKRTPVRHWDDSHDAESEANLAVLRSQVAAHDVIIMSDERLWRQGANFPQTWEILRKLVGDLGIIDIDVVAYLRRQDLFIASLWNQYVKSKMQLSTGLEEFANKKTSKAVMDYDACLRSLEEAFGKEHITLRIFDKRELVEGDIRHDFCSLVGIEITPGFSFREDESNTRLSDNVVEIKRLANESESYRESGDNFLYWPAVRTSNAFPNSYRSTLMSPELQKSILDTYAEGNARIARDYFAHDDGALFEQPNGREAGSGDNGDYLVRDTVRLLVEALADEHKRLIEAQDKISELEASLGLWSRVRRRCWRNKHAKGRR